MKNDMIKGTVIHGKKLGREIGFPTANLDVSSQETGLEDGIYAAKVVWREEKFPAALVINRNAPSVEVHILDFSEDLYDEVLEIEPKNKVSEYYPIDDMEELKVKIAGDVNLVNNYFRKS